MAYLAIKADDYVIFFHSMRPLDQAELLSYWKKYGGKKYQWTKGYSAQVHSPHTPMNQTHVHVYLNRNQMFALNQDGTAHDRSHGVQIPNKVQDLMREHLPEFTIPPDGRIASFVPTTDDERMYLSHFQKFGSRISDQVLVIDLSEL